MLSSAIILAVLFGLVFGVCILFLPTGVAMIRNHPNKLAIFLVNLFLGWTFLGWVAALVWACSSPVPPYLNSPIYALAPLDPQRASNMFSSHTAATLSAGAPYRGPR